MSQTEDAVPDFDDDSEDARNAEREEQARRNVADATNVEELCSALNAFEQLRQEVGCGEIDTWPIFDEEYSLDWSDFSDEPVSVDAEHVLFVERVTGRYYFMTKADCEYEDEV